jgi:alpha-D-ribose 1-methylphosphonate 5-triphosphate synthase subunit PhnI
MALNNFKYSKQMPHWFFRVPHVRFGYRYHPAMDVSMCNRSMLHLHNQSLNVLTHFLPALYFVL